MPPVSRFLVSALVVTGLLVLCTAAAAAPGIETFFGDDVTLAGYSTGGPFVYLFLTGPNIPENGVALNDITKRADQGYFTRVSVDGSDDRWTYTWHTGSVNGRLDAGTYTVWVVDAPLDRSRLAYSDFSTIGVTLKKPYISVETPALPGSIDLRSDPEGASVTVNGEYRGVTPLLLGDLPVGIYTVGFSRDGFAGLAIQVRVEPAKTSEVLATLLMETGTLALNSTPPGARAVVDGEDRGTTPVILANITPGNHTVTLTAPGYTPATIDVTVSAGKVSPVEIILQSPATAMKTTAARSPGLVMALAGALVLVFSGIVRLRRQ